jgi:hypothetical protein
MSFLIPGPLQIDPEWMTGALRRVGAIRRTKVVEMTCKPVGNRLVGDSYRFALAYDENEHDAPASVIGKFPAAADNRQPYFPNSFRRSNQLSAFPAARSTRHFCPERRLAASLRKPVAYWQLIEPPVWK